MLQGIDCGFEQQTQVLLALHAQKAGTEYMQVYGAVLAEKQQSKHAMRDFEKILFPPPLELSSRGTMASNSKSRH